ncbi:hypothetical protein [Veronia pacifica]|uniref:Uncharacterized protein n=1 Tax=Veronia pacifica TaxID=1080227 RepID=A0A1C3EAG1_9GAMM|nr:hypothetical protein [Veronia pacifica]ODA30218.1 hypothetical protein A8L45_20650 [Veronia pacifica]
MILLAISGDEAFGRACCAQLSAELGSARLRRLYLGHLPELAERVRRIRLSLPRLSDHYVTVATGVNSEEEAAEYRRLGGMVCHPYGSVSLEKNALRIRHGDVLISPSPDTPSHVLEPLDVWSEHLIQRRVQRQEARV